MSNAQEQKIKYNRRIIIFFDILGFKDLIDNNLYNPELVNRILETAYLASEQPYNCQIINFSDTIIQIFELKYNLDDSEDEDFTYYINNLLDAVQRVQMQLLVKYGVVIRGSIVLGEIYYNRQSNTIFGPALNRAAELEKLADTPRVIIDSTIINNLKYTESTESVFFNFSKDEDGYYYANPFKWVAKTNYEQKNILPNLKVKIEEIINKINSRKDVVEPKKVLRKYEWLLKKLEERENEDLIKARDSLITKSKN